MPNGGLRDDGQGAPPHRAPAGRPRAGTRRRQREHGYASAKAIGALLALAVATFIYVTTETLPIGLLLLISADLGVSPSAAGLLVTWYGLVVVVASLPLTQLTRRVPRRLLLSGLLAVFVVATWVSAAAASYRMLLGARVVTALSQALFWSVVVPTAAATRRAGGDGWSPWCSAEARSRPCSACPWGPGWASRPAGGRRSWL